MLEATVEKDDKLKLKMEWRTCPCGQSFKVLSTSPQIYHNRFCEEQDNGKTKKPIKDKKKSWESLELDKQKHGDAHRVEPTRPEVYKQQKEDERAAVRAQLPIVKVVDNLVEVLNEPSGKGEALKMEPIDLSKVRVVKSPSAVSPWDAAVTEAKGLVFMINKARFDIAGLALRVCIIRKGGDQKTDKYKTGRSLKDFAKQVGVCHKTLCEWVRIKRNVIDKLPEGLYMPDKYAAAQRTADHVTRDATPKQVEKAYKREVNNTSPQFYFDQLTRRARLQANYLQSPENDLSKISKESIQVMFEHTKASLKVLKSHLES